MSRDIKLYSNQIHNRVYNNTLFTKSVLQIIVRIKSALKLFITYFTFISKEGVFKNSMAVKCSPL